MPWLAAIKLWPWRTIGLIGGAIAVIGAIVGLVFAVRGMVADARDSGFEQGRAEVQGKWNAEKAGRATARAELSEALAEAFNGLDGTLQRTVKAINKDGETILVQVTKEMDGDPRYSSTDCSLTPGVRAQIDAARGLSGPGPAATVHSGGLPTSGAAVRLDIGGAGDR